MSLIALYFITKNLSSDEYVGVVRQFQACHSSVNCRFTFPGGKGRIWTCTFGHRALLWQLCLKKKCKGALFRLKIFASTSLTSVSLRVTRGVVKSSWVPWRVAAVRYGRWSLLGWRVAGEFDSERKSQKYCTYSIHMVIRQQLLGYGKNLGGVE